jgi:hypothetical protein
MGLHEDEQRGEKLGQDLKNKNKNVKGCASIAERKRRQLEKRPTSEMQWSNKQITLSKLVLFISI